MRRVTKCVKYTLHSWKQHYKLEDSGMPPSKFKGKLFPIQKLIPGKTIEMPQLLFSRRMINVCSLIHSKIKVNGQDLHTVNRKSYNTRTILIYSHDARMAQHEKNLIFICHILEGKPWSSQQRTNLSNVPKLRKKISSKTGWIWQ